MGTGGGVGRGRGAGASRRTTTGAGAGSRGAAWCFGTRLQPAASTASSAATIPKSLRVLTTCKHSRTRFSEHDAQNSEGPPRQRGEILRPARAASLARRLLGLAIMKTLARMIPLGLLFTTFGCAIDDDGPSAVGQPDLAQLQPAASCGALLDDLRSQALAEMNRRLDANLESALAGNRCWNEEDAFAAGSPSPGAPSQTAGGGARSVSTTNNQVAGVDEADFVKNDSRYVYILAAGSLQIIDAWPVQQAHVVSRTPIAGELKKLFVHDGHAVVYSSPPSSAGQSSWSRGECTYGYSCDFTGDGKPTTITVLDIADVTRPRLVRTLDLSGSLLAARRIDGAVHTALTFPSPGLQGLEYWPQGVSQCGTTDPVQLFVAFSELRQKNTAAIMESPIESWLPSYTDTRPGSAPQTAVLGGCDSYYISQLSEGQAFLSVLSLDSAGALPARATTVIGQPGAVYASDSALYVAARHRRSGDGPWFYDSAQGVTSATTIHKFRFYAGATTYAGSGVAKGHVLSQFSLDEHRGYLRIATSSGHVPDPNVHSTVTVLRQGGLGLDQVGVVDDIAPHEDIRSVRFDGERGFIVIFKKTDPLFSLDLADPSHPLLVGELKIPGFSTYMHMLDDDHLLTIGYDAADQGSFAFFQGVLLQIFDVSNLADPRLAFKASIGTRGTSSEALTNHLAFNYFAPAGLLAVPMTICEGATGSGSFGDRMTFTGLQVWDVSTATGFSLRGGVAHVPTAQAGTRSCGSWWTDAKTEVKRSIFMDDYVLSIARDIIHIQDVRSLGTDVNAVPLTAAP